MDVNTNFIVVESDTPAAYVEQAAENVQVENASASAENAGEAEASTETPTPETKSEDAESESTPDDAHPAGTRKPRSAQKRINQAIAKKAAAESRAAELERSNRQLKAELEALKAHKPVADEYETYEDYVKASDAHKQAQETAKATIEAEAASASTSQPVEVRTALDLIAFAIDEAENLPDDFVKLVYDDGFVFSPDMVKAISTAANPVDLLYALAKDKHKAASILELEPVEQIRAIIELENSAQRATKKPISISQAPAPISPVSTGSDMPRKTLAEMTFSEHEAYMNAKERRG